MRPDCQLRNTNMPQIIISKISCIKAKYRSPQGRQSHFYEHQFDPILLAILRNLISALCNKDHFSNTETSLQHERLSFRRDYHSVFLVLHFNQPSSSARTPSSSKKTSQWPRKSSKRADLHILKYMKMTCGVFLKL